MLPSPDRQPLLYVASVSGLSLIGFLVIFLPWVGSRVMRNHALWSDFHAEVDPFDEGAHDFNQGSEAILPAVQRHPAYLLGYLSNLVPGCTAAGMTKTNLQARCVAPSGALMAHGNHTLQVAQAGTSRPRFDYDGIPFDHAGKRIRFPSLADNVTEFGFSFSVSGKDSDRISGQLLSAFSRYQPSDIPINGRWDVAPISRFGFRACFLSRGASGVSAYCYPDTAQAAT